jgi:hypothetical protein
MQVVSTGNRVLVTATDGWNMEEGRLVLTLKEARTLRIALENMRLTFGIEGVGEDGEDG